VNKLFYSLNNSQFIRFIVTGIFNTFISYGIFAFLLFIDLNYATANLIALVIGILFSFKTQGYVVFKNNNNNYLIFRFIILWSFIYFFTIIIIGKFIATGMTTYMAGAFALPFSTALSYLGQKYFVFRK